MVITALAGTGKTTIAGVLLDIYLRGMPEGEAVVILVPSRTLRDEHVLNADHGAAQILGAVSERATGLGECARCSTVLWLGRPAQERMLEMWESEVFEATQVKLGEPLKRLKERWPVKQQLEHVKHDSAGRSALRRGAANAEHGAFCVCVRGGERRTGGVLRPRVGGDRRRGGRWGLWRPTGLARSGHKTAGGTTGLAQSGNKTYGDNGPRLIQN